MSRSYNPVQSPIPHWSQISRSNVNIQSVPIGHNVAETKGRRPVTYSKQQPYLVTALERARSVYLFLPIC
jgi:hypothetical protein